MIKIITTRTKVVLTLRANWSKLMFLAISAKAWILETRLQQHYLHLHHHRHGHHGHCGHRGHSALVVIMVIMIIMNLTFIIILIEITTTS